MFKRSAKTIEKVDTMHILIKRAEVQFPILVEPKACPFTGGVPRYSVKLTHVPVSDFSEAQASYDSIAQPHDTLDLIKFRAMRGEVLDVEGEHYIQARTFDKPLLDIPGGLKDGDLCDAVLELYRVMNPTHCGVAAKLIYIRKVRDGELPSPGYTKNKERAE